MSTRREHLVAELDELIAHRRRELESLETARRLVAGEEASAGAAEDPPPPPLGDGPGGAASGHRPGGEDNGRSSSACSKAGAGEGRCGGELVERACEDCGDVEAVFVRCERHGGARGAGGELAAHRRYHCEGA